MYDKRLINSYLKVLFMAETEEAMSVKEEITLHLQAAGVALKRGNKKALVEQLTLALNKAENEDL